MPDSELELTLPYVDEHVYRFRREPNSTSVLSRISRRLHWYKKKLLRTSDAEKNIDRWFFSHWEAEVRMLQRKRKYKYVLVEYVFHSRFLNGFGSECLKIIDTHDKFANRNSELQRQGATGRWFDTTEEGERIGLLRGNRIIAIQDNEKGYFEEATAHLREVFTVGHFCDINPLPLPPDLGTVGILASENPLNVDGLRWFLSDVWPAVLRQKPTASLLIGGRICNETWDAPNTKLAGIVDNVSDFYARCVLTINPMQAGTGLKIKTVEALAHGRIVVGTPVAFVGLESHVENVGWLCLDHQQFANVLIRYLKMQHMLADHSITAAQIALGLNRSWRQALQSVFSN